MKLFNLNLTITEDTSLLQVTSCLLSDDQLHLSIPNADGYCPRQKGLWPTAFFIQLREQHKHTQISSADICFT